MTIGGDDIKKFLDNYPYISIVPDCRNGVLFAGRFDFIVNEQDGNPLVNDSYELEIYIPHTFPRSLPVVKEKGGKIPNDGKHHVNRGEKSLCLGSPISLLRILYSEPSVVGYVKNCLIPYLYAVSLKINHGIDFVFGELPHGNEGILKDYSNLFGVYDADELIRILRLLTIKKRLANKKICPCGCKGRLGRCNLHYILNDLRKMAPRSWFKFQLDEMQINNI